MPINPKPYLGAFRILCRDYERAGEYVELEDSNKNTYSHRLFELLIRACTEFESLSKDKLIEGGCTQDPDKMNIFDYCTLNDALTLSRTSVGILVWKPTTIYVDPFKEWASPTPSSLSWYKAYNSVKHNRNQNFREANLANVSLAIAGLFALLASLDMISKEGDYSEDMVSFSPDIMELTYGENEIYSLRKLIR